MKPSHVRFTPNAGMKVVKPAVLQPSVFRIEGDLSGGVRFTVGDKSFVVSPERAAQIQVAIGRVLGRAQ